MLFRLAIFISIILFIVLITSIDLHQVGLVFQQINLLIIGWGILTLVIEIMLKSWRLQLITNLFAPLTFFNSLKVFLIGRPFGLVTPGQVGDLARTYSLANHTGLKKPRALALSFLDKAFDLFFLLIFAFSGLLILLFLNISIKKEIIYLLIILVIVSLIIIIFMIKKNWVKYFFRPIFYFLIPKKYQLNLKNSFESFYEIFLIILKNKKFLIILIISLIIWPIVSLRVFILAQAMALSVNLIYFLLFIPTIAFIEMVPISIMGIGPREYAYILFLSLLKIDKNNAVTLSLLTLLTNGIPVALVGYYFIVKENLSLKKIKEY